MKKLRFIVNPISGGRNGGCPLDKYVSLIEQCIDKQRYDVDIVQTLYAGHAMKLAEDAVYENYYAVVAVGGDGTVNEVGRGLLTATKVVDQFNTNERHKCSEHTAMGIVPSGSGNGLARHLHIPLDVKGALAIINDGLVKRIDYGLMNDIPFFCTCGVGFDALVALKFRDGKRRGLLTYLNNALQEFLRYQPETYTIEYSPQPSSNLESKDEDTAQGTPEGKHKAFLITCCNAGQYGNNAFISPHASLHDGLLDVTILSPFTVFDIPLLVFQLFNRLLLNNSRIKTFSTPSLTVRRAAAGCAHYDGDPIETTADLNISVVKDGLQIIAPRCVSHTQLERLQSVVNPVIEEVSDINRQTIYNNIEFLKSLFRR